MLDFHRPRSAYLVTRLKASHVRRLQTEMYLSNGALDAVRAAPADVGRGANTPGSSLHPHEERRICTENAHPLHTSRHARDHCVTGAESIVHPVPVQKNSNDDLDGRHGYARQCIRNCVNAAANIVVCAAVKSAKSNETGANRGGRTVVALHDVVNAQGEG